MPLKASASNFVPRMNPNANTFVPQMNPNANTFVPQMFSNSPKKISRGTAARNIQRRYRGNKSRNLTKRKNNTNMNRPIDYNVQRNIMDRYILQDDYDGDLEDNVDRLKTKLELNMIARQTRLDDELKRLPSRLDRIEKGKEEQRLRHRRARTKRVIRAMSRLPDDQRQDYIPNRVDMMTDREQQDMIDDFGSQEYDSAEESGSSDDELDSDDEVDMLIKKNRRKNLEYYREQHDLDKNEEENIYAIEKDLNKLDEKLYNMKKMDVIRCKRVKEMVDVDPMLYRDKEFYEMYIKPCKDETTDIYIDMFFDIDWKWIKPIGVKPLHPTVNYGSNEYTQLINDYRKQIKRFEIEKAIDSIPGIFYPRSCKTALIDCLIELELLTTSRNRVSRFGPPFSNFDVLSNFFKWNKSIRGERVSLRHLDGNISIVSRGLSGKNELQILLELFEETVLYRKLKHQVIIDGIKSSILIDKYKIEKMKRYFILLLIGVVGNPTYIQQLLDIREYILKEINNQQKLKNIDNWIEWVSSVQ